MSFVAPRSTSSVKITPVKRGRRLYGGIHEIKATGRKCYLAYRRQGEIFRSGEKSISDAIREGTACWALDEETLLDLKVKGIQFIGILVKETGDIYMTTLETYLDKDKAKLLNYTSRGGALQRYLPLHYFTVSYGKVKIKKR